LEHSSRRAFSLGRRLPRPADFSQLNCLSSYDRGVNDICCDVISFSASTPMRLQILPEQKNMPSAQASTRREFGPFAVIVA
jgi:hypothetical protein